MNTVDSPTIWQLKEHCTEVYFSEEEIWLPSCALGNLLPLSQSINSALQNDSFEEKKTSRSAGRRGYQNGAHSEIEVAKETDWTADRIYLRSKRLLQFMEKRWQFSFTENQMEDLIYISFAIDNRDIPPELQKEQEDDLKMPDAEAEGTAGQAEESELGAQQIKFWTHFVDYCNQEGRGGDLALRKPSAQNWYNIPIYGADFHIEFTLTRRKYLSLLIYAYNGEAFSSAPSGQESEFGAVWFVSVLGKISTAMRCIV